jgi:phosphatidylserine decarboxylase
MKFAREGYPFIVAGLLLTGATWMGWSLEHAAGGAVAWTLSVLAWTFGVLTLFVIWFFRSPVHALPADTSLVLAPGQGHVVDLGEIDELTYMGGRCRKISIFLSIFDVHVQRAPVSGCVEHRAYRPGRYMAAWRDKASDDNEQASLGIATANGRVLVRQIAGWVARRIVTDPGEGDAVERGQRIGIIRFGSRVDLFLPLEWDVTCAKGDKVVAGRTVLARQPSGTPATESAAARRAGENRA